MESYGGHPLTLTIILPNISQLVLILRSNQHFQVSCQARYKLYRGIIKFDTEELSQHCSNSDSEEPGRRQVHGQVPQHQLPIGQWLLRWWRQKGRIQSKQALNVICIKSHEQIPLL